MICVLAAASVDNWRLFGSKWNKKMGRHEALRRRRPRVMKKRRVIIVERLRMLASGQSLVTRSEGEMKA